MIPINAESIDNSSTNNSILSQLHHLTLANALLLFFITSRVIATTEIPDFLALRVNAYQ